MVQETGIEQNWKLFLELPEEEKSFTEERQLMTKCSVFLYRKGNDSLKILYFISCGDVDNASQAKWNLN